MRTLDNNIIGGRGEMVELPEIIGGEYFITTLNGNKDKYLNLDNAATTPTFRLIERKLNEFLQTYGSVHRGSGIKSQISTAIFEKTILLILDFLGVSADDYALIFTHNTTSAINKLSRMMQLSPDDTIYISEFEHSANDLPWRKGAHIVRVPADDSGLFDIDYFANALKQDKNTGKKFAAISGSSNITGAITPIHDIAKIAHAHNAYLMVDAAQLVAHRAINMRGVNPNEGIDFISFSGHKMYAPYGGGVLVGRRELLERTIPEDVGGGSVDFVTNDSFDLARDFTKRTTSGTPNVLGAISMALSCEILKNKIGFQTIMVHEQSILDRARKIFPDLKGIKAYCDLDYNAQKKSAMLTFNINGFHPNLVAARLGHEFGIGVRQGAICQFSFVAKLLGLQPQEIQAARKAVLCGQADRMFGIVRASFGLENTVDDVDRLAEAIREIMRSPKVGNDYFLNEHGEYWPKKRPQIDASYFFEI